MPLHRLSTALGVLTLLGTAACGSGSSGSVAQAASNSIEIVVDGFGVPHVYATDDREAFYGMGWACAHDRFFQMSYERLLIRGRSAEVFGPDAGGGSMSYVLHDLRTRLSGFGRLADEMEQSLDATTRSFLQAYCDGVNDFVQQAGVLHPLFTTFNLPVEPWTPSDCIGAWMRLGRFISGNPRKEAEARHDYDDQIAAGKTQQEALEQVLGSVYFDDPAAVVQQADVPAAVQAQMLAYAQSLGLGPNPVASFNDNAPKFSQAWAVAGSRTTTNETVVFGDPRLPVRVPNTFWEVHIKGATFEVSGVGVPGSPNLLIGSTPHVAWAVTALGMDQADLFELTTDPVNQPGRYLFEGQWVPYETSELETILVKGQASVPFLYRETSWGPKLTRAPGDGIVVQDIDPTEEFAWRWVPHVEPDVVPFEAFLAMYRSQDVDEFGPALAGWNTPPVHCVFGDDTGRIGYWSVGSLPVRNPADVLGGAGSFDGSTNQSRWLGIVPHGLKPWVLDPAAGWLGTANHLPVGAWYPIPFIHHGGHSLRSWRLFERLQHLFPTPASIATPDDVLDIHSDGVWPPARDVVRLGVHLRDQQQFAFTNIAGNTLQVLEPWADAGLDGQLSIDALADGALDPSQAKASTLAIFTGRIPFRSTAVGGAIDAQLIDQFGFGEGGYSAFLRAKVEGLMQVPAVDLTATEAAVIEFSLTDGWNSALALAGPESNWANWYVAEHLNGELANWGNLEGLPPLFHTQGIPVGPVPVAWGETLQSAYQQSYSRFTALGPGTSRIETLMPLGQSDNPASPHWDDQRALWEAIPQVLKAEPFDRTQLVQPTTTTTLNMP